MAVILPDPSSSSAFIAFTVAVLLAALSFAFFSRLGCSRRFSRPLPPGPWGVPLLGNLPSLDPELHTYFAALASKHGPVFSLRLGGKLGVVVSSRDAAREVLRDQDAVFANRDVTVAASVATYGGSDIVWSPNGPTWRMLRKVFARELLSGSTLDSFYGLRRREVRAMVSRVAARASKAMEVDIGRETFVTAMNTMTSMLWGGGAGDNDEDSEVLGEEFKDVIGRVTALMGQPNLSDFFPCLRYFDLQGIEKEIWMFRERFDGIFERVITAREKRRHNSTAGSGGADLLDVILRIEGEGGDGKTPFTRTHLKALLMDMMLAGTDTTSNTVEFVLAEMMNRPETVCAVHSELDESVGRDCIIEESQALKLRYLSAAVKESLRLHPIGPLLVPHCPSGDCTVGGYTVPAGSRVFVNAWAIHRDPEIWEDPQAYKPERFLDVSGACSSRGDFSGNDLGYIPFGSGRRVCPGTAMAERTLLYTLATLLHAFDWRLPDGETEVDLQEKFGIVLKKKKPLLLVPTQRLPNPELYRE